MRNVKMQFYYGIQFISVDVSWMYNDLYYDDLDGRDY